MTDNNKLKNNKHRRRSAITSAFLDTDKALKRFLSRFFSDQRDVEDVAQEAYLRAYVAEQQRTIDHPRRYLFRTAKNIALTTLTKKANQITDYLEDSCSSVVKDMGASVELEAEAQQLFGLYCEAVAELPEKCRQVYLLRKVHGLPHKEIAERMSLSVSSVEKYLLQGIRQVRSFVDRCEGCSSDARKDNRIIRERR